MVKESGIRENSEPSVKKRKKEDMLTSKISVAGTSSDANLYKKVIDYEEAEAVLRDAEEDFELYRNICEEFRSAVAEIAALKLKVTVDQISEKKTQAALLFVTLKKLNRLEKFRTKHLRDGLHKVKQQVDSQHLHLQNLLYEVLHLKKEVTKCLQFKSKDEEIDLVPVEEFYKEAPEKITRPEVTKFDSHQLKLARLEWELNQRKRLAAQCHELQAEKETVATAIQKKKTHIDDLAPMLKDILAVTKPVQENLGLCSAPRHKLHQMAYLLPHPLYFLYVQADAHREACDKNISVTVMGDEEEAQRLHRTVSDDLSQDDSDSDNQEEIGKRHHRKKSRTDRHEERKKQLLMKHPLSVNITITLKSGDSIYLTFWYLINLHIVSIKVKVTLVEAQSSICGSQLISGEHILADLFPDDKGLESPNVANHYQLKQVGIDGYNSSQLGLAYIWAQRICGLEFITADKDCKVEPKSTISQACLPGILNAIKMRLGSRIQLYKQVQALEGGTLLSCPPAIQNSFPTKINCSVTQWQSIVHSDFVSLPFSAHLLSVVCLSDSDIFYKTLILRGSGHGERS
ncbi:THO complex subunit 5 isoform X2 [Lycorma delicatula]|uniref:THO complex subunit 5 isoform X2 n=1 Tax=Lycorma delicatula TaxID=130591 RepID=UPI003F515472